MNFKTALILMKTGEKIKRHPWKNGYWRMFGNEIYIHEEDGTITNLRNVNNMYGILLNITSEDWEVIINQCPKISAETGRDLEYTDWDGDKPSKCDTSYSKQSELYKKAYSDYYKKAIERYKKEHQDIKPIDIVKNFNNPKKTIEVNVDAYDKLQEEIRKEFNLPEKNKNIKLVDKKYPGHGLEKGQDTLSRMAKKYNLKRGKRAENGAIDDSFAPSDAELDRLEKELKARVAKLNAKNRKENQEAINKLSSLPRENLISTEECKEAIKKCNNNIRYPKDEDCRRDYTKELKEAAGKPRVIKHPKFMSLHGDLTPESKKQETSDDRLKETTKTTEFTRVAPDVKPSNDYTEEDFKYLYKLFECLYKDGTLEKITEDTLRQIEQDVLSIKKVLKEIMDKNKSSNKD